MTAKTDDLAFKAYSSQIFHNSNRQEAHDMSTAIIIFLVLSTIGAIIDFFISSKANLAIKSWLAEFYVKTAEGDWKYVFHAPAEILLFYLNKIFGLKISSIKYVRNVFLWSIWMTISVYILSYSYAYIHLMRAQPECAPPSLTLFFQVPFFISKVILLSVLVNFLMDYIAWAFVHSNLKRMNEKNTLILLLQSGAFAVAITHVLYSFSFPASVFLYFWEHGHFTFALNEFIHQFFNDILRPHNFASEWGLPYKFDCKSKDYTIFSISNAMSIRVAFIGPLVPILVYVLMASISCLIYYTRDLTKRPLLAIVEGLDRAPRIFTALGVIAGSISALLRALFGS